MAMLNPELARTCIRITMFMVVVSGTLLCVQRLGTAEFIVTATTLVINLVFLLGIVVLVKSSQR
jgi:hypothetical protein